MTDQRLKDKWCKWPSSQRKFVGWPFFVWKFFFQGGVFADKKDFMEWAFLFLPVLVFQIESKAKSQLYALFPSQFDGIFDSLLTEMTLILLLKVLPALTALFALITLPMICFLSKRRVNPKEKRLNNSFSFDIASPGI